MKRKDLGDADYMDGIRDSVRSAKRSDKPWRSKLGEVYRVFNFIAHLTYKRRRTAKSYRTLAKGRYLTKRQAEFLVRLKAKREG